ncbi:MAG: flagellar hook-basal body complex protein [Caulobacter sp.]|nr:flagellar hook-basal body complex protein [Caulobacter sp.]
MSINSAMLAGVSGLVANSSALAAISDNISNVNTIGYKRSQANFQTLVSGNSRNATYAAGGVAAKTRQYVTQQGLPQSTSSATDLAIAGSGFFVVADKAENLQATDARSFTRAGSFQLDNLGFLKNQAGLYLQGWLVDDEGAITVDPSDLSRLSSINVSNVGGAAERTTRASVSANLKSSQAVSSELPLYDPATNSMAMYDPDAGLGIKPDFSLQIPVSDSKGGKRTVQIDFLKSDVPNQWYAEIRAVPASDVITGAGLSNGQMKTGTVAFLPDGRLDSANTTLLDTSNPILTFGASADPAPGAGEFRWADDLGIDSQEIRLELAGGAGGLTQYDSQSIVQAVNTNGTAFGNLTNVEIDESGFVTAIFDNGISRQIAQVAIATFANPDGLKAINGNAYRVTQDSGTYSLKGAGTGGAGAIAPSTLEASTVDLSSEFTGLIVTQRAYSASSKIITTADQMLEELLSIKR